MSAVPYFDTHVTAMATNREAGTEALCYTQQVALLESLIEPGMTVLDIGCGPELPYTPPARTFVIGLDPSSASLAANRDIDAGILGSAERISLDDASADLVVAFYALHHITAATPRKTFLKRRQAFWEMRRVLKPGGELLVFEMCPRPWAATLQRLLWPTAKHLLGDRLDAHFWTGAQIEAALPYRARVHRFDCSAFETFPPILSLPWLRIPRFLFPFDAMLYRWRKEIPA